EIAVIDGERLHGNGLMLPSGPLREPVSRLRSVDGIVINVGSAGAIADRAPGPPRFAMRLGNERFVALAGGEERASADFALATRGRAVAAVAGIGNPARFH